MLVLDRSGSIDSTELAAMKNAADAFITALTPTSTGVHIGQTSFSTGGTLDLHLTDDEAAAHAAVASTTTGGLTNLFEGIDLATGELDDAHAHERSVVQDVMVILTDGNPNVPGGETQARASSTAAADAARAADIEVFVVGIGGDVDSTFLANEIADDAQHYFTAANFDDLQDVLVGLTQCE
jgi:Mg-chelatase subunit ChlD